MGKSDAFGWRLKVAPDKGVLYSVEGTSPAGCIFTRYAWVVPQPLVVNLRDGHVFTCADTCTQIKLDIGNDCDTCGYSWQPIDSLYKNDACSQSINSSYKKSYANVRFTSATADTFYYTAYGIDSSLSCLGAGNVPITVYVQDAKSITADATDILVFEGAIDTLFASPDTLGDYTWIGCNRNQSVGDTITINPEDTCTYTVISNNEGCCSWDDITIYTVGLEADCAGMEVCTGCSGTVKVLTASIEGNPSGIFTYQWYKNGNGTLYPPHTGNYDDTLHVTVGVADTFFCKVNGGSIAGIGETNEVIVKKAYLPLGWECASLIIYDKQMSKQESLATLKLYPNPSTGSFTVDFSQPGLASEQVILTVKDFMGSAYLNQTFDLSEGHLKQQIQTSLSGGIYLVSVCSVKDCSTQKLVIAR